MATCSTRTRWSNPLSTSSTPTCRKLFELFDFYESEANRLIALELPLPTYEMVLKASHTFNLLDARRAISVTERQRYILRVRTPARAVAQSYLQARARPRLPHGHPPNW